MSKVVRAVLILLFIVAVIVVMGIANALVRDGIIPWYSTIAIMAAVGAAYGAITYKPSETDMTVGKIAGVLVAILLVIMIAVIGIPAMDPTNVDCGSEKEAIEVQAIAVCLKNNTCDVSKRDIEKLLAYRARCRAELVGRTLDNSQSIEHTEDQSEQARETFNTSIDDSNLQKLVSLAEQGNIDAKVELGDMYYHGAGVVQDQRESAKWFRLAAEQGNAVAQTRLGVLYGNGHGVPKDPLEAAKWHRRAAEQGNTNAQFRLGVMYDIGLGVPKDFREMAKWMHRSAEQGNDVAQSRLGYLYSNGRGVIQDYLESATWYRLAAEQGDAYSQHNLGEMYRLGLGVRQDYVIAHMYLNLAASQGHEDASELRDLVAQKITPDQLAEAQQMAKDWYDDRDHNY